MSQSLLESVQIPCKLSDTKEWYNVDLVEKLLQILFSACQHGSKIRLVTLDAAIDMLKVKGYWIAHQIFSRKTNSEISRLFKVFTSVVCLLVKTRWWAAQIFLI